MQMQVRPLSPVHSKVDGTAVVLKQPRALDNGWLSTICSTTEVTKMKMYQEANHALG